ncbi:quinolinate synthase NadA [bacterium]|nr:quinolinate synthase NadA [bacterium]
MEKAELIEKINRLKKEKNAVILAHSYQNIEVDEVADFVGDSLELSRKAKNTDASTIIFAGVYFMAETAKLLSPKKKVLIPRSEASCEMADMITGEKLREFKTKHPSVPVVCYINSTAEVKALSDICCTSSNAVKVVQSVESKDVLFVPDRNLAAYVQTKVEDKNIIPFDGCCPIHDQITPEDVEEQRNLHPNAILLAHPECRKELLNKADFIGSTKSIFEYVKNSRENEFIISTETGVVERLERDYKDKKFYLINKKAVCRNMKYITLDDILKSLQNDLFEVTLSVETAQRASLTIERMLKIS